MKQKYEKPIIEINIYLSDDILSLSNKQDYLTWNDEVDFEI